MKHIKGILSTVLVVLALLICGASTVVAPYQAVAANVQVANAKVAQGKALFDAKGRYAVLRTDLKKGETFSFFGCDWRVVCLTESAVTFWMKDPYEKYAYNLHTAAYAGGIHNSGSNIWGNGYSGNVWYHKDNTTQDSFSRSLGMSGIRAHLQDLAATIIDQDAYKSYANKVIPGYVEGNNMKQGLDLTTREIGLLYFSRNTDDKFYSASPSDPNVNTLTASWNLTTDTGDSYDRLWLPAVEEVRENGKWDLSNTDRNWSDTAIDQVAWLRTPDLDNSYLCSLVGATNNVKGVSSTQSIYADKIGAEHGVRPAIHLSLASLQQDILDRENESNPGNNNGTDQPGDNNGQPGNADNPTNNDTNNTDKGKTSWFNDDVMKVVYIVVCVLGVLGVILVTVAVVAKTRARREAESEAN